jgi:phosphate transport system permease protein
MKQNTAAWFKSGAPWVWGSAATVSISLLMVASLLIMLTMRGFGHFWPSEVVEIEQPAGHTFGERKQLEEVPAQRLRDMGMELADSVEFVSRRLMKTGNRDMTGQDFYWLLEKKVESAKVPKNVVVLERREWGNFYGRLRSVKEAGVVVESGDATYAELQTRLARSDALFSKIKEIERDKIGAINYAMEKLRLKKRALELKNALDDEAKEEIRIETASLQKKYESYQSELHGLYRAIERDSLVIEAADGKSLEQPLRKVVRAYQPNKMSLLEKLVFYFEKLWEFVSDDPREANTEGGIFPAIFGTIMMVFLMSLLVTPLGVIAAIYLREYAKQGFLTRTIRIAVNNLAGVPSIVYGIFGLGFFVYFLGGNIDRIFYPEALPAPTFGTPGLMWAALTLAILTMPVVIVSTEEGLSRVPKAIREGSLALGATKAETLWRTVIPMASPSIMTGMILAIARAAGEVAPLMLVGVVKLAPALPLDGNYPFLHLDRKFMHLGFHIYDVGFQSPNVEAARPLVYATALLLVVVIVVLNLAAISIRNRLREKYKALES